LAFKKQKSQGNSCGLMAMLATMPQGDFRGAQALALRQKKEESTKGTWVVFCLGSGGAAY
jgi:hypothetical protein